MSNFTLQQPGGDRLPLSVRVMPRGMLETTAGAISKVNALYTEVLRDPSKWTGNFLKATRILKRLLADQPNNTHALTCLGAIYSDQGKHREALSILRKAERLGSTDRNLYTNIGIVMMNLEGHRDHAMKDFRKAGKFVPDRQTIEAYFDPQAH